MRVTKYFERDIFTHEWVEISENDFNNMVVKYRDRFNMRYEDNGNTAIFSLKTFGYDCYKRVYSSSLKGGN